MAKGIQCIRYERHFHLEGVTNNTQKKMCGNSKHEKLPGGSHLKKRPSSQRLLPSLKKEKDNFLPEGRKKGKKSGR